MVEFPLWIAKNENMIIVYDSNLIQVYSSVNTSTIEKKIREIVDISNKHKSINLLKDI